LAIPHGQFSAILALAWVLGLLAMQNNRGGIAGSSFAVLLIKPQLAVLQFLTLALQGHRHPSLSLALIASVAVAVSIAISGPAALISYPQLTLESTGWDGEWGIYPERMLGVSGFLATILDNGSAAHMLLSGSIVAALILVMLTLAWRSRAERARLPILFSVVILTSLLINPHLYHHDLLLVYVAIAFGLTYSHDNRTMHAFWIGLLFANWATQSYSRDLILYDGINVTTPTLMVTWALAVIQTAGWIPRRSERRTNNNPTTPHLRRQPQPSDAG